MTPAGFDTRRRSLGLSIGEAAAVCGSAEKTVNRWQSGYSTIPPSAEAALDALEDRMQQAVDEAVDFAKAQVVSDDPITLWRYRTAAGQQASRFSATLPPGAHAILIGWAADALEAEDFDVVIEWAD